ncbi:hypothetical protein NX801_04475 [Streptomyces sp. LP05-1]|uniref:Uncharacterized protein n=1 Tax=Streptomyces pyxinae TaxID=2970734 RepID=A0ABT2CBY7_9ACTN|nr:hypothetical protein [Streptomyces sp. LP05-1]MCS0634927.1 hypothetical protein [Streptomyces sp. LP05-1]
MKHVDFDACDLQRLRHAVNYAHHASETSLETLLPPWIPRELKRRIKAECVVSHCATLLFPPSEEAAAELFRACGWNATDPIPSVLVKQRLTERHRLPEDARVLVTRLRPVAGPEVEVFLFPKDDPHYREDIGKAERAHNLENHVGLFMARAREETLRLLTDRLETVGRLVYEGCAHNPHENTTMVYFAPEARMAGTRRRFPRWEVQCPGDLTHALGDRPVRTAALADTYAVLRANVPPGVTAACGETGRAVSRIPVPLR